MKRWAIYSLFLLTFSCHSKDDICYHIDSKKMLCIKFDSLGTKHISECDSLGMKDGKEISYYSDGKIVEIGHYKRGLADGKFIIFLPQNDLAGQPIIEQVSYFKNNKLHGNTYFFYIGGEIEYLYSFNNGSLIECPYHFDRAGNLIDRVGRSGNEL